MKITWRHSFPIQISLLILWPRIRTFVRIHIMRDPNSDRKTRERERESVFTFFFSLMTSLFYLTRYKTRTYIAKCLLPFYNYNEPLFKVSLGLLYVYVVVPVKSFIKISENCFFHVYKRSFKVIPRKKS